MRAPSPPLPVVVAAALALAAARPAGAALSWSDRAAVSPTRGHHAGGTIGDVIYVAGGGYFGTAAWGSVSTARKYDPVGNAWSAIAPMADRRTFCAGAVAAKETPPGSGTFEERLYVLGGMDIVDPTVGDIFAKRTIAEYDPLTNGWRTIAAAIPDSSVGGIRAVTVGNRVFMMGGFSDIFANLSRNVHVFDPNDPLERTVLFGTMPAPMDLGACDGTIAAHGTKIYYFGGYSTRSGGYGATPETTTLILDTSDGTWAYGADVPRAIVDAAALTVGDTIYLVGGWDGTGTITYVDVWAYDVLGDAWSAETPIGCMPANPGDRSTQGRAGLSLHLADDGTGPHLHAVGGSLGISIQLDCHEYTAVPSGLPPDTEPPVFGGALSAEDRSCGQVEIVLAWDAAVDLDSPPVTYNVYRSTSTPFVPGPANRVASGVTTTTWTDTDASVACGQDVYYVVRAQDSAVPPNEDANLNVVSVSLSPTCTPPPPPDPALDLRVTKQGIAELPLLDWSRYVAPPEVTHYHVRRTTSRFTIPGPIEAEPAASPFLDTGAFNQGAGFVYYFDVRAAIDCEPVESVVPGRNP